MSWADNNLPLGMEDLIYNYYFDNEEETYATITEINDNYELVKIVVWEDKGGTKHRIKDMSIDYILNCMRYIIKNNFRRCYLPLFEKEIIKRGYKLTYNNDNYLINVC